MHDDLEKLIGEWRGKMRESLDAQTVEEMEDHLREKVAALCAGGLENKKAFNQAVRELGSAKAVGSEFRKLETRTWLPIKIAVIFQCVAAPLAIAFLIARLRDRPLALLLGVHVFSVTMGYMLALMAGAIAGCFVLRRCFGDFSSTKAARISDQTVLLVAPAAVLTAIGIGLAMIWANLTWGRAWSWDPKEIGATCILWWLICFVACGRSGRVSPHRMMMLAIIGNIVVSCGWFGSNMLMTPSYSPFLKAQLYAVVLVHLLLLAVGMLPAGCLRQNKRGA